MDKITRMLLLYSKLIRGDPVNKAIFCLETESSERSFDRDIEDIRMFFSEIFSVNEVIYNRATNLYFISGVAKKELEVTEYRFVERLLFQAGLLRKDELEGILYTLASNTTRYRECVQSIRDNIETYENTKCVPFLKMHEDLSKMIIDRRAIKLRCYDVNNIIKEYEIIPLDIEIMNGRLYLLTVQEGRVEFQPEYFLFDRIESFTPAKAVRGEKWNRLASLLRRYRTGNHNTKSKIVIECKEGFVETLRRHYLESPHLHEEHNGKYIVTIEDDDNAFVEWILAQDTRMYCIIEPEHIKNKIRTIAEALYKKYKKEQ